MSDARDVRIDPSTPCEACGKAWSEHWGFNCDEPYAERKFRPLLPGTYPWNRAGNPNSPLVDEWREFTARTARECPHAAGERYRTGEDRYFFCVLCPDMEIFVPYRPGHIWPEWSEPRLSLWSRIKRWWARWRMS